MRELIKTLLRENLLNEKLADVDADVDMLYDMFFREDVEQLNTTGKIIPGMFVRGKTNTSILTSPECVEAHKLNPCKFLVNTQLGNYYSPEQELMGISVNFYALEYVKYDYDGDYKEALFSLDGEENIRFRKEFSEARIKGSIHHELAHWIDDTMHNKHIKKRLTKAQELGTTDIGNIPVNATKMEVQGQIHNVKQLKNKYHEVWDSLTFKDMIDLSPSLNSIFNQLKRDVKTQWLRDIKTRMHREGLLGAKMR